MEIVLSICLGLTLGFVGSYFYMNRKLTNMESEFEQFKFDKAFIVKCLRDELKKVQPKPRKKYYSKNGKGKSTRKESNRKTA